MSHHFTALKFRSKIISLFAMSGLGVISLTLFAQAPYQKRSIGPQNDCTGSVAGTWLPMSSQPPATGQLTISLNGNSGDGDYVRGNDHRSLFSGSLAGTSLRGDWVVPGIEFSGGTFEVRLFNDNKLEAIFYRNNQEVDRTYWECRIAQSQPPTQPVQPPTQPTTSTSIQPNYDEDNFRSFDALPKEQQMSLLARNGPRLPKNYNWNDISLRVFVHAGVPMVFDYSLVSEKPAQVFIETGTARPFLVNLEPSDRTRVQVTLPPEFGSSIDVGRMRVSANRKGTKADFHLFGIGIGEQGVQALNGLMAKSSTQLALLRMESQYGNESASPVLFAANPFLDGSGIEFDQPTTITAKQKPEQNVSFRATLNSDFTNGAWKFYHIISYGNTEFVWTDDVKHISAGQTIFGKWNGIKYKIFGYKKAAKGDHQLHLTTWIGPDPNANVDILTAFDYVTIQ